MACIFSTISRVSEDVVSRRASGPSKLSTAVLVAMMEPAAADWCVAASEREP